MEAKKELISKLKKAEHVYIIKEDRRIEDFSVTQDLKKEFKDFFKENKYQILKNIVLFIAPEDIKKKYGLNEFLISVAIKMYENDEEKFKRNAKAIGASEEELVTFDKLAEEARKMFNVESEEFANFIKNYCNYINDLIANKKICLISFNEINNDGKEISKEKLMSELEHSLAVKSDNAYRFSLNAVINVLTKSNTKEVLLDEAMYVLCKFKNIKKQQYLIVRN